MLKGINPLLGGQLLLLLDRMGHSDKVVIADAHFPSYTVNETVLEIAAPVPEVAAALCTVMELDDVNAVTLMNSNGPLTACQQEIVASMGLVPDEGIRALDRWDFYKEAKAASFVIRTSETRIYGNVILSKGVTLL